MSDQSKRQRLADVFISEFGNKLLIRKHTQTARVHIYSYITHTCAYIPECLLWKIETKSLEMDFTSASSWKTLIIPNTTVRTCMCAWKQIRLFSYKGHCLGIHFNWEVSVLVHKQAGKSVCVWVCVCYCALFLSSSVHKNHQCNRTPQSASSLVTLVMN